MTTGMRFGKQLQKARLQEGLSQARVAEKLGLSTGMISHWENGRGTPSASDLKKLRRLLGSFDVKPGRSSDSEGVEEGNPGAFGTWLRQERDKAGLSVNELAERASVSVPTIYFLENGRTQWPLEQTRKKLAEALQVDVPSEITREVQEEQEIEGLGPLTDFDPFNEKPKCSGVYVFYDISNRPIYVGKAKNIANRVKAHEEKFWFKRPIVHSAAFVEIRADTLRHQVEQVLIKFLKSNAVMNKQSVDREEDED